MKIALAATPICVVFATGVLAADFDGDGVAEAFKITRDAATAAKEPGVLVVDPWKETAKPSKDLGFIVRLSSTARTYLLRDHESLRTPAWKEQKPPVETIAGTDPHYRAWKKQVPALQGDAIQLGTEAGVDISALLERQ